MTVSACFCGVVPSDHLEGITRAREPSWVYIPRKIRFATGLIRISLTQTWGGKFATNAIVRPRSSGWSIFDMTSSEGGTGRVLRMGVATSPGARQHALRPLRD